MNKNTTIINIGPQCAFSWLFVSFAAASIAFFIFAAPDLIKKEKEVEIAKIQSMAKK
jgi:hypothetical protein